MAGGRVIVGDSALPITETIPIPVSGNPTANQTYTIILPIGLRYHHIWFEMGGTTFGLAELSNVRLLANTQAIWNLTGTQLDMMNQFDKLPAFAAGKLCLPLERVGLSDPISRYLTAFNTGIACIQSSNVPVNDLRIEIDVANTAVAATLAVSAIVSDVNPAQSTAVLRRERTFENTPGAAGGVEFLHVKKITGDAKRRILNKVMLGDTNANITKIRILENGLEIYNRSSLLNEAVQKGPYGMRTPQAGWCAVDKTERGEYGNVENVAQLSTFELRSTAVVANANLPVIYETLGVL